MLPMQDSTPEIPSHQDYSPEILFHYEDVHIPHFREEDARQWIREAIHKEKKKPGDLNFIFCTDPYLLKINQQYLDHDDLTDILTFDYSEDDRISGDIFISYERVVDNALAHQETPGAELHRVIIHGVLHLLGYKDSTATEKQDMQRKENYYLSLRP